MTCEESLALSRTYGGRIQAGVTLHLMAKIRQQEGRPADALPYFQRNRQPPFGGGGEDVANDSRQ